MIENKLSKTIFLGIIGFLGIFAISCAKSPPSETAAFDKIQNVSEIQSFVEKLNKAGVKPIIRQENIESGNNSLFEYYIGESHPSHNVLWNRFAVDKKTSEIHVFDIDSGNYIPLEEWRGKQN